MKTDLTQVIDAVRARKVSDAEILKLQAKAQHDGDVATAACCKLALTGRNARDEKIHKGFQAYARRLCEKAIHHIPSRSADSSSSYSSI
jgi:hypothetical protein